MPDRDEFVLVRVKKIMPFGAYCDLEEYGIDAYLPIKEIASGWIKNIHEFLKEGQKKVAKVIFIDREKNAVDVSLKKVTKKETKDKIDSVNNERRSENLFAQALDAAGMSDKKEELVKLLAKKYETYADLIEATIDGNEIIPDKKYAKLNEAIAEVVSKNIKPKVYQVNYIAEITCYDTSNGVAQLRNVLKSIETTGVRVIYLGAPKYKLTAENSSYPEAEKMISKAQALVTKEMPNGDMVLKKEKASNQGG